MNTKDPMASALLLLMSAAMGSTFVFNKLALTGLDAASTGAWRLIVCAVALVILSFALGQGLPRELKHWGWSAVIGLSGFVLPFYSLAWAQQFVPSGTAAIYFASIPLVMLMFSLMILRVNVTLRKWLGISIGCIGLVLLAGPGSLDSITGSSAVLPQAAMIVCCLSLASAGILIRLAPRVHPLSMTGAAALIAGLISSPVVYFNLPVTMPGATAIIGVLGVGLIATALAQFLRFFLIRRKGPVFIVPNGFYTPAFGVLYGWIFLGEQIAIAALIALEIMVLGVVIGSAGSGAMKQV